VVIKTSCELILISKMQKGSGLGRNYFIKLFVKGSLIEIYSKTMAWAARFGFPGSQARPKPLWGHDFGLAWLGPQPEAMHITSDMSIWDRKQQISKPKGSSASSLTTV
jgi:hypothetical protein